MEARKASTAKRAGKVVKKSAAKPKKKKAAAKKKFDVYPSAYANIWASKYCKGKVGRKKKADGGSVNKISQSRKAVSSYAQGGIAKGCGGIMKNRRKVTKVV